MITCHLSRIMGEQRINMTKLAEKTGLSRNTIYLLYHERTTSISFETMDKLCKALNVKPGDLFEYIPDEE